MPTFRQYVGLFFVLLLVLFTALNTGSVTVDLIFGSAKVPLAVVMLIVLVFGSSGTALLLRYRRRRHS